MSLQVTTTGINQDQCRSRALNIGRAYFTEDAPINIVEEHAVAETVITAAGETAIRSFVVDFTLEEQT